MTKIIQREMKARDVKAGQEIALWGENETMIVSYISHNGITERVILRSQKRTLKLQPEDTVFVYDLA